MLYFFWAILNIGLFIFICVKGFKYLKEGFGSIAALVFVLFLFAFVGNSNSDKDNKEPNSNQIKTWNFISAESLDNKSNAFINIELETTWISKYNLGILYGMDKEIKNNIPVSANTWITGFESGTSWNPISIIVNRTNDNQKFGYEIKGAVRWTLLGITVYSQPKNWKGIVSLK